MQEDRRLGNFFARRCAERRWNISELARRAGVTRPTMYRYLTGENFPEVDKRREIAPGFGFSGENAVDDFDTEWLKEPMPATPELIQLIADVSTSPRPTPSAADIAKRRNAAFQDAPPDSLEGFSPRELLARMKAMADTATPEVARESLPEAEAIVATLRARAAKPPKKSPRRGGAR